MKQAIAIAKFVIPKVKALWARLPSPAEAMASAKAFWASLPHQVQTTIVVFVTVGSTTLAKELQAYLFGTLSFSVSSLRHDVGAACVAGYLAAKAFNMLPNRATRTASDAVPPALEEKK